MRQLRLLARFVALLAIAAPAAAATMVPDPDWIGGLFDGAAGAAGRSRPRTTSTSTTRASFTPC
jgi:hypothetical protein